MKLSFFGFVLLSTSVFAAPTTTISTDSTSSSINYAPQFSPNFPGVEVPAPVYNIGPINTNEPLSKETLDLSKYPGAWESPDVKHPEVQEVIKSIDWNLVPKIPAKKGGKSYNDETDPDCWWTSTGCVKPMIDYIPDDIYTCPTPGEWGLTYDDGPFNLRPEDDKNAKAENPFAEPYLYNFLAKENIKASLFYIGSNVMTYPAAAKRALSDGHTLCSHSWSHPVMTTQTNEQVVAELYWTLKAIKEATGVTVKCWRPPQGDVDDRVRAIAWQMGMRTVLWNRDTEDWDMPAPGGGKLPPSKVDAKFEKWIANDSNGTEGILVLEHELNHATVQMTEKWMPKMKENFDVVSAMSCNDILQPYWEQDFTYPAVH